MRTAPYRASTRFKYEEEKEKIMDSAAFDICHMILQFREQQLIPQRIRKDVVDFQIYVDNLEVDRRLQKTHMSQIGNNRIQNYKRTRRGISQAQKLQKQGRAKCGISTRLIILEM